MGSNLSDTSAVITVPVFMPGKLDLETVLICAGASIQLDSLIPEGFYLSWYDAATNGALLNNGGSLESISEEKETQYWLTLSSGPSLYAGKSTPNNASLGTNSPESGLAFEVTEPFNLEAVDVYPTGISASEIAVHLTDSAGNILRTAGPFALPAGTGNSILTGATAVKIPVDFQQIDKGYYRLVLANATEAIIADGAGNMAYPLAIGNLGNITHATDKSGNELLSAYPYFYNWQVSSGCQGERQKLTVKVDAVEQPQVTYANETLSTGNYATYQWLLNGVEIPGANQQTYKPAESGSYTVEVSNLNACTTISEPYIYEKSTRLFDVNPSVIKVYPNPVYDHFFIDSKLPVAVYITDANGRKIYADKYTAPIDLSNFSDGLYFVQIIDENKVLLKVEKINKLSK